MIRFWEKEWDKQIILHKITNIYYTYNRLHVTVKQQKHAHTIRPGILTTTNVLNYWGFLTISETVEFRDSIPALASMSSRICRAWASYQIHKIAGAHAPGMPGTFSPSPQVSDPGMHHGTCVTHVPWCMPGSLTNGFFWNRRRGKTFPAFPAHAQPAILHIW